MLVFSAVDLRVLRDAPATGLGGSTQVTQVELIPSEVTLKFDATGPGVEWLEMEPPAFAGLAPIMSTSVSPIPPILIPGKPVPTSQDGIHPGAPYCVAARTYGGPAIGRVMYLVMMAVACIAYEQVARSIRMRLRFTHLVLPSDSGSA